METRTEKRRQKRRLRIVPGGRRARAVPVPARAIPTGVFCQYGVVVGHSLFPGMELIEYEFLTDAA